jgi:hypothetical protein
VIDAIVAAMQCSMAFIARSPKRELIPKSIFEKGSAIPTIHTLSLTKNRSAELFLRRKAPQNGQFKNVL